MKLWLKTAIAVGVVSTASAATIGGVYLFNKHSNSANGKGYASLYSLQNQYPKEAWDSNGNLKNENDIKQYLDVHFYKPSDVITSNAGRYEFATDTVNGVPYETWKQSFIDKNQTPPAMVVYFGATAFTNDYVDAVSPADFTEYVAWFITHVPWSGDLGSLERFNIKRGIQQDGSAIILGAHENKNKERQEINFYPDAFFGSLPGYSIQAGRGQMADNLLMKLSTKSGQLLRKSEIERLAQDADQLGMAYWMTDQGVQSLPTEKYNKLNIRYIKPVDLVDSIDANGKIIPGKKEQGYEVYADEYAGYKDVKTGKTTGNLIDDVARKYPYLLDEVEGYHVVDGKLVYGKYKTVTSNTRIPFLAVLAANPSAAEQFKGPGINWLKYVGAHEYGHHTTLNTGQDASQDHEYSGAFGTNAGLSPTMLYSRDMQNLYLLARSQHLVATGASVTGDQKDPNGEFIGFLHQDATKTTAEKVEDIYGTKFPVSDISAAQNPDRRAAMTMDQLKASATAQGLSLYDIFIKNAWDTRSGTINPGVQGEAYVYSSTNQGQLIEVTDEMIRGKEAVSGSGILTGGLLTDGQGKAIEYTVGTVNVASAPIVQKWFKADGVTEVGPVSYRLDTTTGSFAPKPPAGKEAEYQQYHVQTVLFDANGQPLVHNDQYTEAKNLQNRINAFVSQLKTNYKISGWDGADTVALGQNVAALGIVSSGVYKPLSWWNNIGESTAAMVSSVATNGMYTLATTSGLLNQLVSMTPAADKINLDLTTVDKDFDTTFDSTKDAGDLTTIIAHNLYEATSFGQYEGKGSLITTTNGRYSILPTGDTSQTARSTIAGFIAQNAMDLNGAARVHNQPLKVVFTDATSKEHKVYFDAKHIQIKGSFDFNTGKLVLPSEKDVIVPYYLDDSNNKVTLSATDAVRIKFDGAGLTSSLTDAASKFSMTLASGSQLNHALSSISSVASYLDKFNIDPLSDFTTVTVNGTHKVTVLTDAVLGKFFGNGTDIFACFDKNSASFNEDKARQVLTKAIFDSETLVMKDTTTDYATLTAAQKASLFAMLSGASDSATLQSSDAVIPSNLVNPSFTYNQLTNIDELIASIQKFKSTSSNLWSDSGSTSMSFIEFSMFSGLQVYTSPMASKMLQELNLKASIKSIIGPSDDIKSILTSRVDDKFGEKFSDYSYNPSESINRDWLQISYMPSNQQLENLPDFLRVDPSKQGAHALSEATTGFNYYIDASSTAIYLQGAVKPATMSQMFAAYSQDSEMSKKYPGLAALAKDGDAEGFAPVNSFDSNYIGKSGSMSDGFFADDMLRRVLNNELYDAQGHAVADPSIRIKDFVQNKQVADRVRATWVWAMKSQGVGSRTLSSLWRSPDRDASYMYGFVPFSTDAQKEAVKSITHVRFTDINTGEVKLLPVHTRQNNLFYYEDRANGGTKHTLEQDGYTSWQSDYAAFGGYRDALLTSGHNYKVEFWNNDGHKVVDQDGVKLTMGDTDHGTDTYPDENGNPVQVNKGRQYISENGKLFGQASTYFEQVLTSTIGTEFLGTKAEVGDSVLHVNNQFNG